MGDFYVLVPLLIQILVFVLHILIFFYCLSGPLFTLLIVWK